TGRRPPDLGCADDLQCLSWGDLHLHAHTAGDGHIDRDPWTNVDGNADQHAGPDLDGHADRISVGDADTDQAVGALTNR
ncbi:MAG TPA: hypothetical protein VIU39_12125, partial [Anaerolineales bacterium]